MKIVLFTGLEVLDEIIMRERGNGHEFSQIDDFGQLEIDYEDADVIIANRYMDESADGSQLQQFVKKGRQKNKNLQVIILMSEKETEFIQAVVSVGIYDIILCQLNESLESISKRLIEATQAPARAFDFSILREPVTTENKPEQAQETEPASWSLKINRKPIIQSAFKEIIAVYSPSNSGATTTALNLGIALTESKQCKVLVMGLDLMNSVMGSRLKKMPLMSVYQMVDAQKKRIPLSEIIEDSISSFGKVDVIPGIFDFNEYYYLGEIDLWRLIRELQKIYDYIVLDISSYLTDKVTVMALKKANRIYLVSEATKVHLGHLERYKTVIKSRLPEVNLRGIIINKFTGSSLTAIEIETITGERPVTIINESTHLTALDGIINKKRITKAYKQLVKDVIN